MDDPNFNKQATIIRSIIGAVLSIASVVFLWKGIAGSGEIGLDFQIFSGKFSTTSAGFALLVAGVILLLSHRPSQANRSAEQRSLGQMIVGIVFYIFVGLLPVLAWIGITIYINYFGFNEAKSIIPMVGMYAFMIEIPLLFWVVDKVSALLKSGDKK